METSSPRPGAEVLNGNQLSVVHDEAHAVVVAHDLLLVDVSGARPTDIARTIGASIISKISFQDQNDFIPPVPMPRGFRPGCPPDQATFDATRDVLGHDVEFESGAHFGPGIK